MVNEVLGLLLENLSLSLNQILIRAAISANSAFHL